MKYTKDHISVRLSDIGIPVNRQDNFINFQLEYGGTIGGYGLNRWVVGLIHESPKWLEPDKIEGEYDRDKDEYWATCCDGHMSDWWTINDKGQIFWCHQISFEIYHDFIKDYKVN